METLVDERADAGHPDFELEMPPGWRRHGVDDEALAALLAGIRRRCLEQHQPELFASLKPVIEQSFTEMRSGGVFAYFAPADPGPATLALPASINACVRTAEPGGTLDDLVRMMVQHHGATPLIGDKRIIRMERERELTSAEGTVVNHSIVYLTPVPGTRRTKALQLVAAFPRLAEVSPDAEEVDAMRGLFDLCVSTLRWPHAAPA